MDEQEVPDYSCQRASCLLEIIGATVCADLRHCRWAGPTGAVQLGQQNPALCELDHRQIQDASCNLA
jgi:hypothetical protein